MRYLHGDSSPFPLNENFLETLACATDTCVALVSAELAAENLRSVTQHADECIAAEMQRLDALGSAVEESITQHGALAEPTTVTEATANKIIKQARASVEEARAAALAWRNATVRNAAALVPSIVPILNAFLVRNQMPATDWSLHWKATIRNAPVRARVHATTPDDLQATFDVSLPNEHLWAQPLRASVLEKSIVIPMLQKSFFGRPKLGDEHLENYFITEVTRTPERASMVLRRSNKEPSPGLEIFVRDASRGSAMMVARVNEQGARLGDPTALGGHGGATIERLWDRIENTIGDVVWYRRRLVEATYQGTSVVDLERPAILVKVIIEAIAPYVVEMHRHSRTRGELALKRDLGDGRREELFIHHHEISRKYSGLPARYRAMFEALGLEEEARVAQADNASAIRRVRRIPAATPAVGT